VLSGCLLLFGITAELDGSGFLAVNLCGIIVNAKAAKAQRQVNNFFQGMAWISQIGLFLMLGLLVTPKDLPVDIPGSLVIASVLMFVARPLASFVSLAPLGFSLREKIFVGWVRVTWGCSNLSCHYSSYQSRAGNSSLF
jgi:cell volume regulation protein A